MARGIIIAILAVAVAGTAYWGYQEREEKNAVLLQSENNYQRAFHDLTYQIDLLNDKIGTTLAMNSRSSLSPALTEVWRITSEAQNDVGFLPLGLLPFNKTEEFLSEIGNFSYQTAVRDLENEPLTEDEYAVLQNLYEQSGEIQSELRDVQTKVIENNLRFTDIEMALAAGEEVQDNSIIDGLEVVEQKVTGYSEASQFGPSYVTYKQKEQSFRNLTGKEISKDEALDIARRFVPTYSDEMEMSIKENKEGSDFKFYSIDIDDPKTDSQAHLDVTKVVGYPIIFMNNREIGKATLSLNEAAEKAKNFLEKQNYTSMDLFESSQYDSVGIFNFVHLENGIRVYSDSIKVKIALDDGDVIGYSAEDYLQTNKEREILEPAITVEEAKAKINSNVDIMENRLAIITNSLGEEVLCHEFIGVINNDTYRIYINAQTNAEELVEKLSDGEPATNITA